MRIPSTPARAGILVFASLAIATMMIAGSTPALRAWRYVQRGDLQSLEKAAIIEPTNDELYARLADAYLYAPRRQQPLDWQVRVQKALQRATDLNPYDSKYWLTWTAFGNFDIITQTQAAERAYRVEPSNPATAHAAADARIAGGDTQGALPLYRTYLEHYPHAPDAMRAAFAAAGTATGALRYGIPENAAARLDFLRFLLNRQQWQAADDAWAYVINSPDSFDSRESFFYLDSLLARDRVQAAKIAWDAMAARDTSLQRRMAAGNLVINGGFEENILNGGFDWRYVANTGAKVSIDTSVFHEGTRSLAVAFDGENISTVGLVQMIPVEPNRSYTVSAMVRAEEIESASGPRLRVSSPDGQTRFFQSDDVLGSTGWNDLGGDFRTGADTHLLKLEIVRDPSEGRISGKLWIDNVRLQPK